MITTTDANKYLSVNSQHCLIILTLPKQKNGTFLKGSIIETRLVRKT